MPKEPSPPKPSATDDEGRGLPLAEAPGGIPLLLQPSPPRSKTLGDDVDDLFVVPTWVLLRVDRAELFTSILAMPTPL